MYKIDKILPRFSIKLHGSYEILRFDKINIAKIFLAKYNLICKRYFPTGEPKPTNEVKP